MSRRCLAMVAATIVLLSLRAVPSRAAEESTSAGSAGPNYLAFKLGGYFPDSSDLDNFDAGLNAEVALGRHLAPYVAVEGAVGYWKTENDFVIHQEVQSTYFLVAAKLTFPAGSWQPYVEGGGGVYLSRLEESTLSDKDAAFGVHAGAGIDWYFTPEYFLGLGGRYLWAETRDNDIALDGLIVNVNLGLRF